MIKVKKKHPSPHEKGYNPAIHPIPREHELDDRHPSDAIFMIAGIIGFIMSVTYTFSGRFNTWFAWSGENAGITWGFVFMLFFLMLFISSIISMTPRGDKF